MGAHEVQVNLPRYADSIIPQKEPDKPAEEKAKNIISSISSKLEKLGQ